MFSVAKKMIVGCMILDLHFFALKFWMKRKIFLIVTNVCQLFRLFYETSPKIGQRCVRKS